MTRRLPVYSPPATYGDCIKGTPITGSRAERMGGKRRCEAYRCKYNLDAVLDDDVPGRRHNGRPPPMTLNASSKRADSPSCALDMAERPHSCTELAAVLGDPSEPGERRRWQQVFKSACEKLIKRLRARGALSEVQELEKILEQEQSG